MPLGKEEATETQIAGVPLPLVPATAAIADAVLTETADADLAVVDAADAEAVAAINILPVLC